MKIHSELKGGVDGTISFDEILVRSPYSVAAGETFQDPYNPERTIQEVTGTNRDNDKPCKSYKRQKGEEPKH